MPASPVPNPVKHFCWSAPLKRLCIGLSGLFYARCHSHRWLAHTGRGYVGPFGPLFRRTECVTALSERGTSAPSLSRAVQKFFHLRGTSAPSSARAVQRFFLLRVPLRHPYLARCKSFSTYGVPLRHPQLARCKSFSTYGVPLRDPHLARCKGFSSYGYLCAILSLRGAKVFLNRSRPKRGPPQIWRLERLLFADLVSAKFALATRLTNPAKLYS
jgi:hypothetical protein